MPQRDDAEANPSAPPAVELNEQGWPILRQADPAGSAWERHDDPTVY